MKNSDFKIQFNDDFKIKLKELVFYITYKLGNSNAGFKLKEKIIKSANSLCNFPERHPIMQIEKQSGIVVRKFVVGKYLICYFVDNKTRTVHINNLLTSK